MSRFLRDIVDDLLAYVTDYADFLSPACLSQLKTICVDKLLSLLFGCFRDLALAGYVLSPAAITGFCEELQWFKKRLQPLDVSNSLTYLDCLVEILRSGKNNALFHLCAPDPSCRSILRQVGWSIDCSPTRHGGFREGYRAGHQDIAVSARSGEVLRS